MRKFLLYILAILFILKIQVLSVGCAVVIPPMGGARDSLPPVLVDASPPDSSKNFNEKKITLTFDEYITVDNARENLLVSPVPENAPVVEPHLKTVVIRLKDTLQPNTTYSLNFGKAIKDVDEGNINKNFTYIFSTGQAFDSLTLSGKVIIAETGKSDSTLIVMLHQHGDDSAVVKEKPRYIARLDSSGNFTFRNLPHGTFYIYALDDQSGQHKYLSENQIFAFADTAVVLQTNNSPIILYAFGEKGKPSRPGGPTTPQLGNKKKLGNQENRLKLQTNLGSGNQLDLLDNLTITSELPFRTLDTSLIHFSMDSTFLPVTGYSFEEDSSQKKLTLKHNWKENTLYHVILEKNFAEDTLNRGLLKTDTITVRTKKLSDYGSLRIRFKNFNPSVNPVLQFVQNDNVYKSIPLTSAEINESIFPPGDYQLRILYDRNKNGKWDSGQFFGKRLQPEVVKIVTSRSKITIKPDWDNEFDIAL